MEPRPHVTPLPSTVHRFRSTTTSFDISPPRYSFIASTCARMNELKMMMWNCVDIDTILLLILNTLICILRANKNSGFDMVIVLMCAKSQRKGLNTLLCFERAKENNAFVTNEESHLHGAAVLRHAFFIDTHFYFYVWVWTCRARAFTLFTVFPWTVTFLFACSEEHDCRKYC